jgi:hypothetical protein
MTEAIDSYLRHVALLYRDQAEYLVQVLGFAQAGMARGEPLFIAVPVDKARLLGDRLAGEPGELLVCDMAEMGRNPARIIPEVRAFADKHLGQHVRFFGEPSWPGGLPAETR